MGVIFRFPPSKYRIMNPHPGKVMPRDKILTGICLTGFTSNQKKRQARDGGEVQYPGKLLAEPGCGKKEFDLRVKDDHGTREIEAGRDSVSHHRR
jgi:hypothetical protein